FYPLINAAGAAAITMEFGKQKVEPYIVERITNQRHQNIYEHEAPTAGERIYKKSAAQGTVEAMQAVTRYGTVDGIFNLPNGPLSLGAKTGTSTNKVDLNMIATACDEVYGSRQVAMWYGNPSGSKRITGLEHSNQLGYPVNTYFQKTMTSGKACDISKKSYMPAK
ncbi:MAG TPA: hypothetical protein VF598_01555, partial [Hymenobacter sp.]